MPEQSFYAYLHRRPDNSIFYVGKGCGRRAFDFSSRTFHHKNVVSKYGKQNIIVELVSADSESHAFALERALIRIAKQHAYKIVNMSDGGEGGKSGYKLTDEAKRIISRRSTGNSYAKGIPCKESTKIKLAQVHAGNTHALGYKHTPEAKEKIRATSIGRKHMLGKTPTEETKKKLAAASKLQWGKIRAGELAPPKRIGRKGERTTLEHRKNAKADYQRARRAKAKASKTNPPD